MRRRDLALAVLGLHLTSPLHAAPALKPGALRLELSASTPTVAETAQGGGWRFTLALRNATRARQCALVPSVVLAHGVSWEILDERGGKWQPTFLPPSPPPPGWPPPPRRRCLAPGAELPLGSLDGLSGFHASAHPDRWYHQPPAGRYRARVIGFKLDGLTLDSGEAAVLVQPADAPVSGLRLALAASPAQTQMLADGTSAAPVTLRLTLSNAGAAPLTVAVDALLWRHVRLHVDGPSTGSSEATPGALPAPRPADRVALAPGRAHTVSLGAFPPGSGLQRISLTRAGWYRLRAVYQAKGQGAWQGEVSSNFIWLEVRPRRGRP